jgi:hypothetical protein
MSKSIDLTKLSVAAATKSLYQFVREIGSAGGGKLIVEIVDDEGATKKVIKAKVGPLSKKQLKELDAME